VDLYAHRFHGRFQDRAGSGVELHLHEMAGKVHDMHLAAVVQEPAGGFQAEQAAADHGGASALPGLGNDGGKSSMVRKPNTPGLTVPSGPLTPAIGGMKARLPVAISSLS
jgi:hypothetical protein